MSATDADGTGIDFKSVNVSGKPSQCQGNDYGCFHKGKY
nr:hypothetical protein [Lacticaseibacillus paracasei]